MTSPAVAEDGAGVNEVRVRPTGDAAGAVLRRGLAGEGGERVGAGTLTERDLRRRERGRRCGRTTVGNLTVRAARVSTL